MLPDKSLKEIQDYYFAHQSFSQFIKRYIKNYILILAKVYKPGKENVSSNPCFLNLFLTVERRSSG